MNIAVTGATGFVGRYMVAHLAACGHKLRCWYRPTSDRNQLDEWADQIDWIEGKLGDAASTNALVDGCDAVVHGALWKPGNRFQGGEGDVAEFAQTNIIGSLQLIEAARRAKVGRFIYISTCAVHDLILHDRPLDEAHPLWPKTHYGAHKAAVEKFVHSYGLGEGYPICALRPTGVYGIARPIERSKWHELVSRVAAGETVKCRRGGKEVHAADVARAVEILLRADDIAGQAYSCYDRYVSQYDVAIIAKRITDSASEIIGGQSRPKNEIVADKLLALGMRYGGEPLLEQTIGQMVEALG